MARIVALNASDKDASILLSRRSMYASVSDSSNFRSVRATHVIGQAKPRYWEVTIVSASTAGNQANGIANGTFSVANRLGEDTHGWAYTSFGHIRHNATVQSSPGNYSSGDTLGYAFKGGKLWIAKNNAWIGSGNPVTEANPVATGLTGDWYPCISIVNNPVNCEAGLMSALNQFLYTPPAGYYTLLDDEVSFCTITDTFTGMPDGSYHLTLLNAADDSDATAIDFSGAVTVASELITTQVMTSRPDLSKAFGIISNSDGTQTIGKKYCAAPMTVDYV